MRRLSFGLLGALMLGLVSAPKPAAAIPFAVTTCPGATCTHGTNCGDTFQFCVHDCCSGSTHRILNIIGGGPSCPPIVKPVNFVGCFTPGDFLRFSGTELFAVGGCAPIGGSGFLGECICLDANHDLTPDACGVYSEEIAWGNVFDDDDSTNNVNGSGDFTITFTEQVSSPEPSTLWLLGTLLPAAWMRRRRATAQA